ncbi:MAG: hypothetical protein V6Z86_05180 [Hyphomicrobiales bacterium]
MSNLSKTSRRAVLRFLAGAPLLPLAGSGVVPSVLDSSAVKAANRPVSVEFIGMDAPSTDETRATTTVESSVAVTYDDGARDGFDLAYQRLFLIGEGVPDEAGGTILAGSYFDINGDPIMDSTAPAGTQFFSDCPDGYSLLKLEEAQVPGVKGNTVFAVGQFELPPAPMTTAASTSSCPLP